MRTLLITTAIVGLVGLGYVLRRRQQRKTDHAFSDSWMKEHGYDKSGDRL